MRIEILLPMIERKHCVNLVLRNIEKAEKPKDCQVLVVISASDEYVNFVRSKLEKIFVKVRIIESKDKWIEHNEIRPELDGGINWSNSGINQEKMSKVCNTYKLLQKNADRDMDYYWNIEDDNLFPLDTFPRYFGLMEALRADIVTGVSYSWYQAKLVTNFWTITLKKVFGENDTSNEMSYSVDYFPYQDSGVVRLGACGLVNVLMKKEALLSWTPTRMRGLGSAADVSFFISVAKHKLKAFGVWDITLPHITRVDNEQYQIMGQIDKSTMELLNV